MVGRTEGRLVTLIVGRFVGFLLGMREGRSVGAEDRRLVGFLLGMREGRSVGVLVGTREGRLVGALLQGLNPAGLEHKGLPFGCWHCLKLVLSLQYAPGSQQSLFEVHGVLYPYKLAKQEDFL